MNSPARWSLEQLRAAVGSWTPDQGPWNLHLSMEDGKRHQMKVLVMEGRFETLPKSEQANARWRAAAVMFLIFVRFRGYQTLRPDMASVGQEIGASEASLKRWISAIRNGFGGWYHSSEWHLHLASAGRQRLAMDSNVYLEMERRLALGQRPTAISKAIQAQFKVALSKRSIQRHRSKLEAAGFISAVRFKNRFA